MSDPEDQGAERGPGDDLLAASSFVPPGPWSPFRGDTDD